MGLDKKGNKSKPTFIGSILTLIVFGTVFMYASLKVQTLIKKKEVDIL